MIPVSSDARVCLVAGHTDMGRVLRAFRSSCRRRCGAIPTAGMFVFRGRRGDLVKILWHDCQGQCLFSKRLERGRFLRPAAANGSVTISAAQLGYLLSGIDWRAP